MPIPRQTAHVLINRIQAIMSAVELDRKEYAVEKLRELSNYIVGRIETQQEVEDMQEPGKPGGKS